MIRYLSDSMILVATPDASEGVPRRRDGRGKEGVAWRGVASLRGEDCQ